MIKSLNYCNMQIRFEEICRRQAELSTMPIPCSRQESRQKDKMAGRKTGREAGKKTGRKRKAGWKTGSQAGRKTILTV